MRQRRATVRNTCSEIPQPLVTNRQLVCAIIFVYLKCVMKESNRSTDNFNSATIDCGYMFRLFQSNHHQSVYQKCKNKNYFRFQTFTAFCVSNSYFCVILRCQSFIWFEEIQQDATVCRYLFTAKLLYMFRASIAPVIRST